MISHGGLSRPKPSPLLLTTALKSPFRCSNTLMYAPLLNAFSPRIQ